MSVLAVVLAMLLEGVLSIKIVSMEVPAHIHIGRTAILTCNYDLGHSSLYAVKWYKDEAEFFRFVQHDKPQMHVFALRGINVNLAASNNHQVVLENVTMETSGKYICEVSAEAPSFATVNTKKEMVVVESPKHKPITFGGQDEYIIGGSVNLNCSILQLSPEATLEWFVNGEKAVKNITRQYPRTTDANGVETTVLGLSFQVTENHLSSGSMTLKCVTSGPISVAERGSLSQDLTSTNGSECHGGQTFLLLFHLLYIAIFGQ